MSISNPFLDMLHNMLHKELQNINWNGVKRSLRPPDVDSDLGCVYPLNEDEVIYTQFASSTPYIARYNLSTGKFVWKVTGYNTPHGIDYNPDKELIAVGVNPGILLLRASNGSVYKYITSVGNYTLPRVQGIAFNPANDQELYFTVPTKHVVMRYNYVTDTLVSMFGTWGTAKSDYTGLNIPSDIEVDPPNNGVLIADQFNSRLLSLDMDLSAVKELILLPQPGFIRKLRWGLTTQMYRWTVISSAPGGIYPMYTIGYERGRRLKFILPIQLDMIRFSPDLSSMWGCEVDCYEFSLDRLNELYIRHPEQAILLNQASVPTSGFASDPLTPFIFGHNVQIVLISDQPGTLAIQVPDRVSTAFSMGLLPMSVPTSFTWVNYDSISTSAGVTRYTFTVPPPVFRVVYTPSASATASLFVYFS